MRTSKIRIPAFSNGTEYMSWESRNCDRCWKASRLTKDELGYTKGKCKMQEEIIVASIGDGCVSERVAKITQLADCPYRQETRPTYQRHYHDNSNYPKLFDD